PQSRLPGEGPPQGTGVHEAQPATARRHCEPAEVDERREEAGVRRDGRPPPGRSCAGCSTRCGDWPRAQRQEPDPYIDAERDVLLDYFRQRKRQYYAFVLTAFWTGAR